MRILEFEISCKDNANREQNKMNSFIFYAEVRLVFALGKDKEIHHKAFFLSGSWPNPCKQRTNSLITYSTTPSSP
jgi:hypothetical protein